MDPVSSALGIATAAIQSAQFLLATIDNIKDAPKKVKNLRRNLEPVEAVLQQLTEALKLDASKLVLRDEINTVVGNCGATCSSIPVALVQWTGHGSAEKSSWRDNMTLGVFRHGRLESFKEELRICKESITFILQASSALQSARQGSEIDSRLQEIETTLKGQITSAENKMSAIQATIISASAKEVDEDEDDFEEDKRALLQELQQQRASNEALQALAKEALKEVHSKRTGQKISRVRSTNESTALAGTFNMPFGSDFRQDLSDISADTKSFTLAGAADNVDLSAFASRG